MQEVTLGGAYVRSIGAGVIDGHPLSITASRDVIVVGTQSLARRMFVFDTSSGEFVRSFGESGDAQGELSDPFGIRFMPYGGHILIAECNANRLSLFTTTGDFVRCIGVGELNGPSDIDFAPNGDILVAEWENNRICVLSPDGSTVLRTLGSKGDSPGQFRSPCTLAMHRGRLYVLDGESARLQVFAPVSSCAFVLTRSLWAHCNHCLVCASRPLSQHTSMTGAHSRSLAIREDHENKGLAISSDGSLIAVSNWSTNIIVVYNLLTGGQVEFGGAGSEPGQFRGAQKMCFSPANSNLLIADCWNRRVQVRPRS